MLFWLLFTRNYKKLLVVTIDVLLCMKIRYACYLDVIFTAGIGSEYWVAITTLFGVCALICGSYGVLLKIEKLPGTVNQLLDLL